MKLKVNPITQTVKAAAHTAPYKVHKYFARRPHNVFNNLIEHYSEPNDIVLDVFCGGGVTLYEGISINRKVIGVDLNPLATFISEMQVQKIDPNSFKSIAVNILKKIEFELNGVYSYKPEGRKLVEEIEWVEWAYIVNCPSCNSDIILNEKNKIRNGIYSCPNNHCNNHKTGVKRTDCTPNGSLPIRTKLKSGEIHFFSKEEQIEVNDFVMKQEDVLLSESMIKVDKFIPSQWDRTNEDKLIEKGILSFKDFFTKRNYAVNTVVFNEILDIKRKGILPSNLIDLLYFSFSASLRHTNNMTRVTEAWENGNPTSMDKHAYWLPNQYVETNVFHQWEKKINALVKALEYNQRVIPENVNKVNDFEDLLRVDEGYMVLNQSSSALPIPDSSVDVIITDPPYGSNVQYNELSSFWNIWYEVYSGKEIYLIQEEEAVMNRKKNFEGTKDLEHYEEMLFKVFKESYRVLKEDSYLVFTFNNKNMKVWFALLKAAARAGFELPVNGVVFQDYIESYKNTAHLRFEGNIQGDFIYTFRKNTKRKEQENSQMSLSLQDSFETILNNTVNELFEKRDKYNTANLYEGVFSGMVYVLMEIAKNSIIDDTEVKILEKKSDSYIDQLLKDQLTYDGEYWKKKGEKINV